MSPSRRMRRFILIALSGSSLALILTLVLRGPNSASPLPTANRAQDERSPSSSGEPAALRESAVQEAEASSELPETSGLTQEPSCDGGILVRKSPRFTKGNLGISASTRGAQVRFGSDGVTLTAHGPGPKRTSWARLSYAFDSVLAGQRILAKEAVIRPEIVDAAVVYRRGSVEEKYELRDEGVEQSFIIRDLPDRTADLVVSGRITTSVDAPADRVVGSHISFQHSSQEVFFVSNAVVKDGAGRSLSIPMEFHQGALVYRVPQAWLTDAVLPVVVDPLVGSRLTVDPARSKAGAAVTYNSNSNESLIVFAADAGGNKGWDIFARRVSGAGALLGSTITVVSTSASETDPKVSYAASVNKYLVVWTEFDSSSERVMGRVMNADGTFPSASFSVAGGTSPQASTPSLAFDGTRWLVAYYEDEPASLWTDLKAKFVTTSGIVQGVVDIDLEPRYAVYQDIAFTDGVYAVAWRKTDPVTLVNRVVMRAIGTDGTLLSSILTTGVGDRVPYLAAAPGRFLLTWGSTDYGARVYDTTLSQLYGPIMYSNPGVGPAAYASVGQQWYSVHTASGLGTLSGRKLTWNGSAQGAAETIDSSDSFRFESLAYNPSSNEVLVVYSNFGVNEEVLYAQRVTLDAVPVPPNFAGVAQSMTGIQWTWGDVQGETGYEVHEDPHVIKGTVGANATSFTEGGFTENMPAARHVHAVNAEGASSSSTTATVHTLVHQAVTQDFTLAVMTGTRVDVIVTPPPNSSSGVTAVEIQRSTKATSAFATIKAFSVPGYTYQDTGVTANKTYYYRIRFQNGGGIANASYTTSVSVVTAIPSAAPSGLAGTGSASGSISWTWSPVSGASSYSLHDNGHLVKGTAAASPAPFILESGIAENALTPRHVHAVNGLGSGPASTTVSVYSGIHTPLATDFTAQAVSLSQVDVVAAAPPNPGAGSTGVRFERSTNGQTWLLARDYAPGLSYSDTAVTEGNTYWYRILYRNGAGVPTAASSGKSVMVSLAPVIVTPSKKTRDSTPLIQGSALSAASISVYFNGVLDGNAVNTNGAWSYSATPKSEGAYTVFARATLGMASADSAPITVTIDLTPPAPPSNVRATSYNNTVDVEWDPSPSLDVSGYNVYRKTGLGGPWTLQNPAAVVLGSRYRDATVVNGNVYYYQVEAVDDALAD